MFMETQIVANPLKHGNPFSGFSVTNIEKAKDFYTNVLGVTVTEEEMGILVMHLSYDQQIILYPKADHQPATFTVLNFPVENIDEAVEALKHKGVKFEQYDYTDEKGIAREMGPLIAWFKDPSGNILSLIEEKKLN